MGSEDDGFLYLPPEDANDQDDMYRTTFPVMPRHTSQESNFEALYLDHGPWIAQNMDVVQPLPQDTEFSSAAQSSSFGSALSSNPRVSTLPTSRVKVALPPIRQRTAQACDKCRERKTKCSGHRPVCLRCTTRGLACEYSARETRLRLPTRSRFHPGHIRPITDSETLMQQCHYQPAAAARSRLGSDPALVGVCEQTPMYPGHFTTTAFSSDRYLVDWEWYRQGPFDPAVVAACDTRLGVGPSPPFNLDNCFTEDSTSTGINK